MFTDQSQAAAAWRMIHDEKRSMAATAKLLGVGTLDVGTMLTAHKKILDARALAYAATTGVATTSALDLAALEVAHRRQKLERARKLLTQGVTASAVRERLGLDGSEVAALRDEVKVGATLQASADRKARKTAVKIRFGGIGKPVAEKLGQRLADVRAQQTRDSWER